MKAFVNSAKDAINRTVNAADATVLFREMRDPDGDWQNGSVYLIDVRESVSVPGVMTSEPEGQFQVVNHGKYLKSLYGDYIGDISLMNAAGETLGNLARAAKDDPAGNAVCKQYSRSENGTDRWACAVAHETPDAYGEIKYVVIAGFDHDENDDAIVPNNCAAQNAGASAFLTVKAEDVEEKADKDTLAAFVEGVATMMAPLLGSQTQAPAAVDASSATASCLSESPWSKGSVYLFIMEGNSVILNANDPGLSGSVFKNVFDEDGVDIWKLIKEAVESEKGGGFIEYKWDNPLITEDDVNPPVAGMAPGTSPKITYVKKVDLSGGGYLVFGSGIYPPPTAESDDDGGCAIARTGDKSPGLLLNLLLIASVLFPAAFLRKGR